MTHEELLEKIDKLSKVWANNFGVEMFFITAMRKVVELHKPVEYNLEYCDHCNDVYEGNGNPFLQVLYPCPTLQVIIEALV